MTSRPSSTRARPGHLRGCGAFASDLYNKPCAKTVNFGILSVEQCAEVVKNVTIGFNVPHPKAEELRNYRAQIEAEIDAENALAAAEVPIEGLPIGMYRSGSVPTGHQCTSSDLFSAVKETGGILAGFTKKTLGEK